jgi:hypothetical protein
MSAKPVASIAVGAALLLGLCGGDALGAQATPGRLWLVHQEIARPAMTAEFESATKEFVALVRQHKSAMPTFHFVCLQGEDMSYTFAVPVADFAAIETIDGEFEALAKAAGDKFTALMARSDTAMERFGEWLVREDPELSYTPASPRLKEDERAFYAYDFYYLVPGREEEAKALAREFVALYKAKGVPDGYRLFWTVLGQEMPMLFVEVGAKDAVDLAQIDARARQLTGAEGLALFARAQEITRRFERRRAWLRPDLSLFPPAP